MSFFQPSITVVGLTDVLFQRKGAITIFEGCPF